MVLIDDNSSDGTSNAVLQRWPQIHVRRHIGAPLFWCRGMHKALAEAMSISFDYYILLNDDTLLAEDAIQRLLNCENQLRANSQGPCIVVGSTQDSVHGKRTYGGEKRVSSYRPIKLQPVDPTAQPQPIDTFNGNIVLIPADVVNKLGNLDPTYEHAFGDIDYGLRARKAGIGVWLAPGFHGICQQNPVAGTYRDLTLTLAQRWRLLTGRKSLPFRSWARFTQQHAGLLWPLYFIYPYLNFYVSHFISRKLRQLVSAPHNQ